MELCALVEPHWLRLGLLHVEDVLGGRYIEINRALHSPVSFPGCGIRAIVRICEVVQAPSPL